MTWRRIATASDTLTLPTVKQYLRVNFSEDDAQIFSLINTSLEYVDSWRQVPSLPTAYQDSYGPFEEMPNDWAVEDTEPPLTQPLIYYVDTVGATVQLPVGAYTYNYIQDCREITISVESPPDIQEDSLIRVDWSVAAVQAESAIEARKLLIGNWYENREASVMGNNTELNFGVNALLSLNSLVM